LPSILAVTTPSSPLYPSLPLPWPPSRPLPIGHLHETQPSRTCHPHTPRLLT
jgi:hypothetical protein